MLRDQQLAFQEVAANLGDRTLTSEIEQRVAEIELRLEKGEPLPGLDMLDARKRETSLIGKRRTPS